ncbi:hypothetical protein [Paraburkholderia sp. J7]|uniref:hypothetical protein n=1 Tax=Paraburkholderia sp. J7 TaxID=2805438 RepID=UPI002AB62D44|nr:hypothetical protein [Paraburkholderia sp. J7]
MTPGESRISHAIDHVLLALDTVSECRARCLLDVDRDALTVAIDSLRVVRALLEDLASTGIKGD